MSITAMSASFRGWSIALALLLLVAVAPVSAETPSGLLVTGTAPVFQGNTATARVAAISDALAQAVDRTAVSVFEAQSLTSGFTQYNSLVQGHTNDFIDTYRVMAEETSGKTYRVLLRVTVSERVIRDRLSMLALAPPSSATGPVTGSIGIDGGGSPETSPGMASGSEAGGPGTFPESGSLSSGTDIAASPGATPPDPSGTDAAPSPGAAEADGPFHVSPGEAIPPARPSSETDKPFHINPGEAIPPTGPSSEKEKPLVLFLVSEQPLNDLSPRFWWGGRGNAPAVNDSEETMGAVFGNEGFVILEHGITTPDVKSKSAILSQAELDNREALDIARHLKADIVVVGKGMVYKVPETMEDTNPSFSGTVTARVLSVTDGREIGAILETAVRKSVDDAAGAQEALAGAAKMAAEKLLPFLRQPRSTPDSPRPNTGGQDGSIALTVVGTRNLGNFVRFRQALNGLEGVTSFTITGVKGDEAVLSVIYAGGLEQLATSLKSLTFELFEVKVLRVGDGRLEVSLVEKTGKTP